MEQVLTIANVPPLETFTPIWELCETTEFQNIVSDISRRVSRALTENTARYDVIPYTTMF